MNPWQELRDEGVKFQILTILRITQRQKDWKPVFQQAMQLLFPQHKDIVDFELAR